MRLQKRKLQTVNIMWDRGGKRNWTNATGRFWRTAFPFAERHSRHRRISYAPQSKPAPSVPAAGKNFKNCSWRNTTSRSKSAVEGSATSTRNEENILLAGCLAHIMKKIISWSCSGKIQKVKNTEKKPLPVKPLMQNRNSLQTSHPIHYRKLLYQSCLSSQTCGL